MHVGTSEEAAAGVGEGAVSVERRNKHMYPLSALP